VGTSRGRHHRDDSCHGTARPGHAVPAAPVWRVGLRWYLIAGLLPAGLWLVGRSLDTLLGRSDTVESVATDPDLAPYLAVFLIGAFIYTLGEELGWRAYALPRLQQHRSALIAALVIGMLWGLWHVPTFIAQGHTGTDLVPLVVSPIAASVLFAWVYNSTGGSLLLVWLFHTASTITGYLFGELPTVTDELVGVAAAVVVVLVAGPTHLSRSRPRQRLSATRPTTPSPGRFPKVGRCGARPGPGDPGRRDAVRFS
jgi:membrane protease YdiL (CAAX protease family)